MFLPLVGSAVQASDQAMMAFGNLKTGLANMGHDFTDAWSFVGDDFKALANSISESFTTRIEVLKADVESGFSIMVSNVKGKASEFKTAFAE